MYCAEDEDSSDAALMMSDGDTILNSLLQSRRGVGGSAGTPDRELWKGNSGGVRAHCL